MPNVSRVIKSRKIRWAGHAACMWYKRGVYRVLVRKPEGKSPAGRPRRRRENIIHMDVKVRVWESMKGLIHSRRGQAGSCKHGEVYAGCITRGKTVRQLGNYRSFTQLLISH